MDTRQLTDTLVADLDPTARPVVTAYLRELAAALPGSRRTREAILTEIADGLIEQITNTTGPDPATAVATAIHTFGNPRNLAAQFARELTGKTAHRTGFALVGSGPLIGALWLLALTSGQPRAITVDSAGANHRHVHRATTHPGAAADHHSGRTGRRRRGRQGLPDPARHHRHGRIGRHWSPAADASSPMSS